MEFEEFTTWVRSQVEEAGLSPQLADDVIAQRRMFDEQRPILEAEYSGAVVGYVGYEQVVSTSVSALLNETVRRHPGRLVYFEPVRYRAF